MPFRVNTSFRSIIDGLGLGTGLKLLFDAGDAASYTSGQSWLDRSGNGYDFFRGTGSGSDAADPTFNGTPGGLSTSEYFSSDGGDFFRYDSANETWMQNIHKDNAKYTMVAYIYAVTGVNNIVIGNNGGTSGNGVGFHFGTPSTNNVTMRAANGVGTSALLKNSVATVTNAAWNFIAASVDEATGTGYFQCNGTQETFSSTYLTPSAASASFTTEIGARGNGNSPMPNGSRIAFVAVWEGVTLTQAQIDDIYKRIVLGVTQGTLTLSGKTSSFLVSEAVTKADLTLSGKTSSFLISTALSSGTLTLVGRNSVLTLEQPSGDGTLYLAPRDSSFNVIETFDKADLTLTGQDIHLQQEIVLPVDHGTLALAGGPSSFEVIENTDKGDLVLVPGTADGVFPLPVEPGLLRLVPREVDLIAIGGGNGEKPRRRKKHRTGFEPIAKKPDRKIVIKRDDFLPPDDLFDEGVPLVPNEPPPQPDFVEPDAVMAMRADITTAQDLSDIERILREMDLDEQDLSDIMDILELID